MKREQELDLDLAINWVTESGVQNTNGGFYAWYDCEKERYSFLYPEITGYAIQFLLELYRLTGENIFLVKAKAAGNWLLSIRKAEGAFNCRYFDEPKKIERSSYVFDAGICLSGLLSLFEMTSNNEVLEQSLGIADWLLKNQRSDGSFIAGYDEKNVIIEGPHWSRTRGCHHLKNLLWLLKLYEIFGDKSYLESAERLLRWGLGLQASCGRFYASYGLNETYSHAFCYAVEGLLKATRFFDQKTISARITRAARWLASVQNGDGSIWNYYGTRRERMKPSEALAQALRIWILTEECSGVQGYGFGMNIRKGLEFLGKMQCLTGNTHSFGGVYYGERNGMEIRHVNTWATLFTIQAVSFLKEHGGNPSSLDALF